MSIAFDLDGVVIDIFPQMRQLFIDEWGHDVVPHKQFNFMIPGKSSAEVKALWYHSLETLTVTSKPLGNSIRHLRWFFMQTGEPVCFITARNDRLRECTYDWLLTHLGDTQFEVNHIGDSDKAGFIKEFGIKYFVDDRFRNINQIAPHVETAFLFNQTWNHGRLMMHNNVKRVNCLGDVAKYFIHEKEGVWC